MRATQSKDLVFQDFHRVNATVQDALPRTCWQVQVQASLFVGEPFMQAQWVTYDLSGVGLEVPIKVGTPVLFDIGVYLSVVGVVLTMIFSLAEAPE